VAEVYRLRFRSRSVRKELDALDDDTYLRIVAVIYYLRENPCPAGIKKLALQAFVWAPFRFLPFVRGGKEG
jgi:hypothetical protein